MAAKAKEASFLAQRIQSNDITFPVELLSSKDNKVLQLLANERALFQSKRKTLDDKVGLLSFEITQIETQIKNLMSEIDAINNSTSYIEKQLVANEQLSEKGFIGKNQLWENQRSLSEKKEHLNAQQAAIATAQINITTIRSQINTLKNEYKQEADDELKETQKKQAELEELLRPIQNKNKRSVITSPLAGQVINLKVSTIGGVIAPGEKLMEIVPTINNLIVEVKINTEDIDSVHVEQLANIQLVAYNRRKTPLLAGKIVYISGDVLENHAQPGNYYYLSHIKVDQESLNSLPDNVKLFPGMPISAFIQTREKTFIDFVLEPIVDSMRRTFREE
jgi:HlyD family type I secretion membrane fusion protein